MECDAEARGYGVRAHRAPTNAERCAVVMASAAAEVT
jgi:hypothetical protein